MKILITGGLSPEAYRLQRILNIQDAVFADGTELPLFSSIKSVVLPAYSSASFVHEMLKSCLDLGISHVYPLKFGEVIELSKARELFSEYGVSLMIPSDIWLESNKNRIQVRGEFVTVLEQGKVLAGRTSIEDVLLNNETGVFTLATCGSKTEYCLYLI